MLLQSLWSRLNKSSCGALGGMLYTEFIDKVRPFSPVLVRCWKCGYLHAEWQTDEHQGAYLTYFHCILNLGPFSYYLCSHLVSQRVLLIATLFFFSFLWNQMFDHRNRDIKAQPSEMYLRNSEKNTWKSWYCMVSFILFSPPPLLKVLSLQACVI